MKAILVLFILLPGCLADVDPSLPQQIEQQAAPPETCQPTSICAAPGDAGRRACRGSVPPNLPHCMQVSERDEDPCNLLWECD